jgi:hypothetical protein
MRYLKSLWHFVLDSLEALADDDRNIARRQRDHEDAQKRWFSFLGSPSP